MKGLSTKKDSISIEGKHLHSMCTLSHWALKTLALQLYKFCNLRQYQYLKIVPLKLFTTPGILVSYSFGVVTGLRIPLVLK